VTDIKRTTSNENVQFLLLDLLNLQSVRQFAEEIVKIEDKIDILVNNAGIADGRKNGSLTRSKDNLEVVLQTNHLSHFLLTNLLKSHLAASGNARVINVSSLANIGGNIDVENMNYEKDGTKALNLTYPDSKLMNIMFSKEISVRWMNIGISSYSLHPGLVRTNIANDSNLQGAQTSLYLCCEPGIEDLSGEFVVDCKVRHGWMNKQALDKDVCVGLWDRSEQLVKVKN